MNEQLNTLTGILRKEVADELHNILSWWANNAPDAGNGGFYGRIGNNNNVSPGAAKGAVLNARILWSFSAACNYQPNPLYLQMADRAYQYIATYFIDRDHGGVYWSVAANGDPLDTKKQVYAIAFTIYAFAEYHKASKNEEARQSGVAMFRLLAEKAYDHTAGGYLEAFTKDWKPIADLRLSAKDANEKKTMNTHLHVLEGYTNLYRIWPDKTLREQMKGLLTNFLDHFIDRHTWHLSLFFDERWNARSGLVSYGHDIEATWLLLEAAQVTGDEAAAGQISQMTLPMADAVLAALDSDGGMWYEYEPAEHRLVKEKHWWVQAEAMVGFFNAWQLSGDEKYLAAVLNNWEFIKRKIIDKHHGEWFWGINGSGGIMEQEDKAGIWKCPYHNSRACLELIRRIGA